jgi:hypothetical protein
MPAKPVEWVLAVFYGSTAHRATYGRLGNSKYTKDYIQLSRKAEFLEMISNLFPFAEGVDSVPLTYQWPTGTTPGALVLQSADRPHLKWETNLGAPRAWKMTPSPSEGTAETIPGDPTHTDLESAENELAQLARRGAGQPYLLAVKLRDEPNKLHLRAYLGSPDRNYAWADLLLVPPSIRALATKTSSKSALAWSRFQSGGVLPGQKVSALLSQLVEAIDPNSIWAQLDRDTSHAFVRYLQQPGYGLFFDPARNHDAWLQTTPLPPKIAGSVAEIIASVTARFPLGALGDAAAERIEPDAAEVEAFRHQIQRRRFEVSDSTATTKTRGSAQRAFADTVKANYGMRCAVTGITSRDFLVASHVVPWSKDQSIRLDPANGICLSLLVDRAFEKGYLVIQDNYVIRIAVDRVGQDEVLLRQLRPYDGATLRLPAADRPKVEYLRRRRALLAEAAQRET